MSEATYRIIDHLLKSIEHPKLGKITPLVQWALDHQNPFLAKHLNEGDTMECGDMLAFRDELQEADFVLWKDFSIKKVDGVGR